MHDFSTLDPPLALIPPVTIGTSKTRCQNTKLTLIGLVSCYIMDAVPTK